MPGQQAPLEGVDLNGDRAQLISQGQQARLDELRNVADLLSADLLDELGRAMGALRGDDPELGAVAADGVDQHGPLAHQKLACPVKHQHALPASVFCRRT